jgi:hypothetical protein
MTECDQGPSLLHPLIRPKDLKKAQKSSGLLQQSFPSFKNNIQDPFLALY